MFQFELKRAFGRKFFIAIIIGCSIAICDFIFSCGPMVKNVLAVINNTTTGREILDKTNYSINIWECFMGLRMSPLSYTYSFILPLLCAFSYNESFVTDRKGYLSIIAGRTNIKEYAFCKVFFGFITAGIVAVIPLIINFILCACFFPFGKPISAVGRYSVLHVSILDDKFYSNTLEYLLIYFVFTFIFYGLLNCVHILGCRVENNNLIAFILPFALYYLTNAMCVWILNDNSLSPMIYTYLPTFYKSNVGKILFQLSILLIIDFLSYIRILFGDN